MKRVWVVLAIGSAAATVVLAPTGTIALPRLAAVTLRAAADHLSPIVPARCFRWEFIGGRPSCELICSRWLPENPAGFSYVWNQTNCDGNVSSVNKDTCKTNSPHTVMKKITSCRVDPGITDSSDCVVTICGVVDAPFRTRSVNPPRVTQPAPKPKPGPPAARLLEGGPLESGSGGLLRQGPAATGTPIGTGGGAPPRAPSIDSLR
jgi:hypothetical protein